MIYFVWLKCLAQAFTIKRIAELQAEIEEYLVYYNQKRIKLAFKGLSPVQYRAQYLS